MDTSSHIFGKLADILPHSGSGLGQRLDGAAGFGRLICLRHASPSSRPPRQVNINRIFKWHTCFWRRAVECFILTGVPRFPAKTRFWLAFNHAPRPLPSRSGLLGTERELFWFRGWSPSNLLMRVAREKLFFHLSPSCKITSPFSSLLLDILVVSANSDGADGDGSRKGKKYISINS